ncbi:MAG TPA: Hsp20/alpha crystallin family protein [Phycisphaerae bacterium]|nr:Hsp20/alpha crystallin family protein [Phycisphaerae bacterium]
MANVPFRPDLPLSINDLRDEFERWIDRVWHGGLNTAPLDGQDWAPSMDVYERPDSYFIRLEVPGVPVEDIDVSILKTMLTVKGTKRSPQEVTDGTRRVRNECRFGTFRRRYDLGAAIREDSVSASCKDGVLFIRIQKAVEAAGRAVKVQSEDGGGDVKTGS